MDKVILTRMDSKEIIHKMDSVRGTRMESVMVTRMDSMEVIHKWDSERVREWIRDINLNRFKGGSTMHGMDSVILTRMDSVVLY